MFSYANSLSERLIGRTQSFISSAMVLVRKLEREEERAKSKSKGRWAREGNRDRTGKVTNFT